MKKQKYMYVEMGRLAHTQVSRKQTARTHTSDDASICFKRSSISAGWLADF